MPVETVVLRKLFSMFVLKGTAGRVNSWLFLINCSPCRYNICHQKAEFDFGKII